MSIITEILNKLDLSGETGERVLTYLETPYKSLYGDLSKIYKEESIDRSLRRAQKRGLIKRIINKEEVYLAITELGRKKLSRKSKKLILSKNKHQWDGKFRLVLFDISEKDRFIRDELRKNLKEFGFIGWQQSVWVTKENVTSDLRDFIKENQLEANMLVIETSDLGNYKLEELLK